MVDLMASRGNSHSLNSSLVSFCKNKIQVTQPINLIIDILILIFLKKGSLNSRPYEL